MDLRQGSKISLLTQLANSHALVIGDAAQWVFSLPAALSGDASGFNTKIKLTALRPNTTYKGFRSFKYNRLDLAELKRNASTTPATQLTGAARVYDCFPYLLKTFGVLFSADDVEDAALTDNGDGTFTIPLTAKATGIFWSGSCQLVSGKLPSIQKVIDPAYFDWSI